MASGLLLDLRAWLLGDNSGEQPSAWRRGLAGLALVVVAHALFEAYAMAATPQLFAGAFYAQGGALRTVQVVVTDVLGPPGVAASAPPGWSSSSPAPRAAGRCGELASRASAEKCSARGRSRRPRPSPPQASSPSRSGAAVRASRARRPPRPVRPRRRGPTCSSSPDSPADGSTRASRRVSPPSPTAASASTAGTCRSRAPSPRGSRSSRGGTRIITASGRCSRAGRTARRTSTRSRAAPQGWLLHRRGQRLRGGHLRPHRPRLDDDARPHVRLPAADTAARARATDASPALSPVAAGARRFPVLRELNDAADPALLAHDASPPSARRAAGRSS